MESAKAALCNRSFREILRAGFIGVGRGDHPAEVSFRMLALRWKRHVLPEMEYGGGQQHLSEMWKRRSGARSRS